MSVSALISGRLTADPVRRRSRAGREYVLADIRAANGAQWEFLAVHRNVGRGAR